MPVHTHLPAGLVVIGASADTDDMLAAIRAAAASHQALRLHGVTSLAQLAHTAALAEGYGWQPRWRFPQPEFPDVVDMHLGVTVASAWTATIDPPLDDTQLSPDAAEVLAPITVVTPS